MIKAVFFDIDGTLLSFKTHKVPQSAVEAIGILKQKGIKVFIATGRHKKEIKALDPLVFDAYITLNGSYCYDDKENVIYENALAKTDMEMLVKIQSSDKKFPCFLGTDKDLVLNYEDDRVRQMYDMLKLSRSAPVPFDEWCRVAKGDVFQLIAFFPPEDDKEMIAAMPDINPARWTPLFADVIAKGTSKQSGIDHILHHYGIALNETMAFGDGGNDIEMLRHVGISIAMGNAAELVQQAAGYVTDTVDDDGIMKGLKHFGII